MSRSTETRLLRKMRKKKEKKNMRELRAGRMRKTGARRRYLYE